MSAPTENAINLEGEASDELGKESWEVARVWITNGAGSHVWIAAWALDDAKSFGHLMAETIRHGAKAYATTYALDEAETLQKIVDGVGEELREQFETITMISPGGLN